MKIIKLLKIVTLIGTLSLLAFVVALFYATNSFFNYFNWFTFSAVLVYTTFTHQLFLIRNGLSSFLKFLVAILIYLPLLVHGVGLVEPNVLEQSWPLMMGLIIFQSGINLVSILGFFTLSIEKKTHDIIALIISLLVLSPIFILFLLNIADEVFYEFMLPSIGVLYVIVVLAVLLKKNSRLTN